MGHIYVIAEAGVNHNGNVDTAKKMVEAAKEAGADYVKFQTFVPEKLVSRFAGKAEYQKAATGTEESQLEMLEKLALTRDDFVELEKYCKKTGIGFLSTPFDLESISFLEQLDMDFWKVPSGEVTNLPYLEAIGKTGRKVVMSTGMCGMEEIRKAVAVLEKSGTPEIILLHCNTQYPTPYRDVNLRAMDTMKKETGKEVGYSDHTLGIEVPIAAAAIGAAVIEKHFTLDRAMEGPDHKASLEPEELTQMVSSIRKIECAMGSGRKELSPSEAANRTAARKSIVAGREIKKGEIFSEKNLAVKRPGNGISPMRWYEVLGMEAKRDFCEDEMIEL